MYQLVICIYVYEDNMYQYVSIVHIYILTSKCAYLPYCAGVAKCMLCKAVI